MAYIPQDAKWYLAEIVEEFQIEDEPENIVHTNHVLIRADSPDQAYDLALEIGRDGEMTYTNPEDKRVIVRFRGLRDLYVIHGELQHGTELVYEKAVDVPEQELQAWVSSKNNLSVFREGDAADRAE